MKRIALISILTLTLACASAHREVHIKPPKEIKDFDAALTAAKEYKVPEYLPDYWDGLNIHVKAAKKHCQKEPTSCKKLFEKVRKSVLEAIEVTYLLKEESR
ncbi:hypothetical protein TST_0900 [Thermosulfidibacter takaii ABI70S6]|uniref:Uncharacterized protein n=1 Tax=Thermosulfidibacter takaii (strain DSM 17441 / JCM 13301 / NBRC 103674 / ABI70S6) TaxID=1298851 RepID=A0A0S3QTN7_THET7|nr:hypothetical protein [Thermosulfidibacter takaii]BAT71700.1 hypothetical protein TST_0900 [Thermosulfidibacter takaii ABI70S6]